MATLPRKPIPAEALLIPATVEDAERWVATTVAWFGSDFDPPSSLSTLLTASGAVNQEEATAVLDAHEAARNLLGDRLRDVVYREAVEIAEPSDDASPRRIATQPPPRWWLSRRPESHEPISVVYEDHLGDWWEWEPATKRLHSAPWLYTDYYYRSQAPGGPRFTALPPDAVREWLSKSPTGQRPSSSLSRQREQEVEGDTLDAFALLREAAG